MAARQFQVRGGLWREMAPLWLQAACSHPSPFQEDVFGRIELVIGRLGAGKTTWGAIRARRLARPAGRRLVTTGLEWPEPWECVQSWDDLFSVENAVVLLDEVHLIAPSTRALLSSDVERQLVTWLSLCRKRRVDVIGTTQAWTRVANHYRQLVHMVWLCQAPRPGRVHIATAHDIPEEGGEEAYMRQFFNPADAAIPTNAGVWVPYAVDAGSKPQRRGPAQPAPTTGRYPVGPFR